MDLYSTPDVGVMAGHPILVAALAVKKVMQMQMGDRFADRTDPMTNGRRDAHATQHPEPTSKMCLIKLRCA